MRHYYDHNASSPLRPEAREAVVAALDLAGNASSVHAEGRKLKALIERARADVARLAGATAEGVTFTSGASEANTTVLTPFWRKGPEEIVLDGLIVSAVEHPSVLAGGRFDKNAIAILPVDGHGRVRTDTLETMLAASAPRRIMVAVQAANSETGVLQPLGEIAAIVSRHQGLFVVDAVQLAGRHHLDLGSIGADVLTLSAHKLGGPQGVGAYVLSAPSLRPHPLVKGGGQEFHLRAGTENAAGIAGFAAACRAALVALRQNAETQRLEGLRNEVETALSAAFDDVHIFARDGARLSNTLSFAIPGIDAETALMALDLAGLALSSGSACSSGKVARSHVMTAMGVDAALSRCQLRISLGWSSNADDTHRAAALIIETLQKLRARRTSASAA